MIHELENLVKIQQLEREPPTEKELLGLISGAHRRLEDAQRAGVSLDGRFDLAYNAAHSLALAALRHHGYRSKNRYIVFQVLIHTLKLPNASWRVLDKAHSKRNAAEYHGQFDVDEAFFADVIAISRDLDSRLAELRKKAP